MVPPGTVTIVARDGFVRLALSSWPSRAGVVVPGALTATTVGLALESGGYFPRAWIWSGVVLCWLAALALMLRERVVADTRAVVFVVALALFVGWALLSALWSVEPIQSILDARRDVVYLAVALVATCGLGEATAARLPGLILTAVTAVAIFGLGHYLLDGPVDVYQGGLLSWPVGYANAFAALAALSLPLALAQATHADAGVVRATSAAALAPLLAVLVLTSSRGGDVAAVAGLSALAVLDSRRRALANVGFRLAFPCVLVVGVLIWADLPVFALAGGGSGRRSAVTVAVIVAAAFAAFLAWSPARAPRGREIAPSTFRALALSSLLLGVVVTVLPELGGGNMLARVLGVERAGYWRIAWQTVHAHPWLGSGGGSFGRAWLEHGPAALGGALDVHNLYLETVAELGPVGLTLLLTALAVPLAAAPAAAEASRAGAAASASYVAFLVHALVDWDWEMPAVTVPALALGAVVVILARRPSASRSVGRRVRAMLAVAAVLVAIASLVGLRSDAVPAAAAAVKQATAAPGR